MPNLKKFLNFSIVLIALVYAGYFFFWEASHESKPKGQTDLSSSAHADQIVNKHMQETSQQMAKDQILRQIIEKRTIEEAKRVKIPEKVNPDTRLPLEKQIHKADLGTEPFLIQKPTYRDLTVDEMSPDQRKEYARQYIENARRGGFLVELDENLNVINATPIRKPSQQSLDVIEILPSN